jgi:hypothetical protein
LVEGEVKKYVREAEEILMAAESVVEYKSR